MQAADGTLTSHYKYSVMAGTPEKMLEHLLDSRLDNKNETEIAIIRPLRMVRSTKVLSSC
ncbi:hypothetical protein DPMN_001776 [Dreissena polymorpha]|uniref:Uncharacterized protein n=1 Tax=Dreissena polymorpha TaxID=45954 RepID=A0A9D4MKE0_DREPO|nr:hypothetical protein DPMN_001776 [Dreissena polymorpha]